MPAINAPATELHSPPPSSERRENREAAGYHESSRDLARGLDVTVWPMLALPDGLVRELLQSRRSDPA